MPSTPIHGSYSSNVYLNSIQWSGWRWDDGAPAGTNITYYFDPGGTNISWLFQSGTVTSESWYDEEKAAYRAAAQSWANVANISFTEVTSAAQADLKEYLYSGPQNGTTGLHETPQHAASHSDGTASGAYNYNSRGWSTTGSQPGSYGYITLVHEIGHALGLAHSFGGSGGGVNVFPGVTPGVAEGDYGDNDLNQGVFTTMSYNPGWRGGPGLTTSDSYGWQSGPMAFDIAAVQFLYGANNSYRTGNDVYNLPDTNAAGTYYTCIWDAGGEDSIQYTGSRNAIINLTAATLDNSSTGGGVVSYATGIHGGFTIANGVVIERVYSGSGNDIITGNNADNIIFGRAGNDRIYGMGGGDLLSGEEGDDFLIGGDGRDDLRGGSGADYLDGGAGNNILYGEGGNDELLANGGGDDEMYGGDGDDKLGGGGIGNDRLYGGSGNDVYTIHVSATNGERVFENANEGNDSVYISLQNSVTYLLPSNIETLYILDGIYFVGNEGDNNISVVTSEGVETEVLDGGAGADNMAAGNGDDTYYVDNVGDKVFENANHGNDTVIASISYTLGPNIENVTLTGTAANAIGDGNPNSLAGNSSGNQLLGNAGNDVVQGFGGNDYLRGDAGADSLYGGDGNDYVYGGSENDVIYGDYTATSGSGSDTLYGEGGDDTIIGGEGSDYIDGGVGNDSVYGNNGADIIAGWDGNDFVSGGDGTDQLYGNAGNDSMDGGTADDLMFGGNGNDSMFGGSGNDQMLGEGNDDVLQGQAGNDYLQGGSGNDSLFGGANNDTFDGGAGNDYMVAGDVAGSGDGASDAFYFRGTWGVDTISGFGDSGGDQDILYFELATVGSFANVYNNMSQQGSHVLLAIDGTHGLWILNATKANLYDDIALF